MIGPLGKLVSYYIIKISEVCQPGWCNLSLIAPNLNFLCHLLELEYQTQIFNLEGALINRPLANRQGGQCSGPGLAGRPL